MSEVKTFSYAGKMLRVNLSNRHIAIEPTLDYAKEWIGAK